MANAIAASGYSAKQLETIKLTVASDTNDLEFDLFMEACRSYRLDPFRKQINAVVYSKNDPKKRKMSIIVARDGLRVLAQRCKDYRPASAAAKIDYDKDLIGPTNPKGIVRAEITLFKQDNRGEWFPVVGEAYWDEFAPVKDEWVFDKDEGKNRPSGKKTLDQSGNWAKMPIVMISKCAESQALRAGWPDQFGNIFSEEEMERLSVDESASEKLRNHEQAEREARVGGRGVMMVFDDAMKLEKVPMGQIADRCLEFINASDPTEAHKFRVRNEEALREFWAFSPADALVIKRAFEEKEKQLGKGAA